MQTRRKKFLNDLEPIKKFLTKLNIKKRDIQEIPGPSCKISRLVSSRFVLLIYSLHGRAEIRNFSSRVKKYFTRSLRSLVKYCSTLEEEFRISAWPRNILHLCSVRWIANPDLSRWPISMFRTKHFHLRKVLIVVLMSELLSTEWRIPKKVWHGGYTGHVFSPLNQCCIFIALLANTSCLL